MTKRMLMRAAQIALIMTCLGANAGMVDFLNGVTLNKSLPEHNFQYLQGSDTPAPRLQVIDFWATWCTACRDSFPQLNQIHAHSAADGVDVVGLTQEAEAEVRPFLDRAKITYPIAIDTNGRLFSALKIKALPYAIVVDASGKIVWRGQPEDLTDSVLKRLTSDLANL